MRILFDLTSLAHNFSGIERYALCLSKAYILQHPEHSYVLIFKKQIHKEYQSLADRENIDCITVAGKNKLFFNQVTLPFALYKIHADRYIFPAFTEPLFFFHKHVFSTIHDMGCWDCGEALPVLKRVYFKLCYRKSILFCHRILTVSEFSKSRIMALRHASGEKICVINGAVSEKFMHVGTEIHSVKTKYHLPDEYILTLSTIEPRKDIPLLIEAYQHLRRKMDVPDLVLAGRKGWLMDEFLANIEPELKNHLHFTGFVQDEDLPALYSNARFYVFPTKYEGFGLPPLEAMACGTPVLSSNAASMPEILGNAALFFYSGDVENLEDKMQEMLALDGDTYLCMTEKGREQARKYSWERSASKLDTVLRC